MKLFALMAIVPMAIGPLPQEERTLAAQLCNGGEITIPIGDKEDGNKRDCHSKACHVGNCREKFKRAQNSK